MRTRLVYPLWAHIPAAAALIYFIVRLATAGPLPAEAPIHFGTGGTGNDFGSPWLVFGMTIGLSIMFLAISGLIDELWARQEEKKHFNWFTFLDEIVVGLMVGTGLGYLDFLKSGAATYTFPAAQVALIAGTSAVAAIILEKLRPYRSLRQRIDLQDTTQMEKDLTQRLQEKRPFVYWSSQNPWWVTVLTIVLPIVLLSTGIYTWLTTGWAGLVLVLVGLLMAILYGGMRTVVTREDITIRFGLPGFRVLYLRTGDIQKVELREFSPLRDFGGYGIRFNGEMTAYYMQGSRGVKVTTRTGKRYLLGSDHPEQLTAVIKAVTANA
jgi:hypothetical protein